MTIEEILNAQREAYLHEYSELSNSCDGAKEILLAMNNESEEELFSLYRPDCLLKDENGEFSMKDYISNVYFNHDSIEISFNEGVLELNPFQWCSVRIDIEGTIQNLDELIAWGEKWIDLDDVKEVNKETGFQEVIHSISIENIPSDKQTIYIDMGTSPIQAFIELLDILKLSGVGKIIIKEN